MNPSIKNNKVNISFHDALRVLMNTDGVKLYRNSWNKLYLIKEKDNHGNWIIYITDGKLIKDEFIAQSSLLTSADWYIVEGY